MHPFMLYKVDFVGKNISKPPSLLVIIVVAAGVYFWKTTKHISLHVFSHCLNSAGFLKYSDLSCLPLL